MANLSNINGKFVIEQTTGYVGVGTTDPNFLIEAAGANSEIALNSTSASVYRLRSTSSDSFIITKNGVGDRLVINGAGNATFAGNVGIGAAPSYSLDVKGTDTDNAVIARFYSNTGARGSFIIRNGSGTNPTTFIGTAGGGEQLSIGTNGTETLRLDASQNVGIGTDSPGSYDGESDDLVVFNSTTPGITIATDDTASRGALRFADGTSGNERYRGAVEYNHNGDAMSFRTAGVQE